ncbi:MAG: hypothetical protein ACLFP4_05600 [Spirochaetales bacterium]
MKQASVREAASLLAYSLFVALFFNVYRWLPDPGILTVLAPPVEALLGLGALTLLARRGPQPPQTVAILVISAFCSALILFGIGEGFYQAVFRQSFVPATDLRFLPALLNMVFETRLFEDVLLVILPFALLIGAVAGLLFLLFRRLSTRLRTAGQLAILLASSVLFALFLAQTVVEIATPAPPAPDDDSALPVSVRLAYQLIPPRVTPSFSEQERAPSVYERESDEESAFALPGIEDRDIHLFVVESYGHTLFTHPEHRRLMRPYYEELEARVRAAGYTAYSSFMVSPAFGGRSWLADATMLSGVFLDSQHEFEQMMGSGRANLTKELGEAGYHRVLAAPGTTRARGDWRRFHEFDQYLISGDFSYEGPPISFGNIPDQYLIHRANELAAPEASPLFLMYMLVSTHVPMNRIPPYVSEASDLGNGAIFHELPVRTFRNNWVFGAEYPEGYTTGIDYTLRSVVDFLTQVDDSPLAVIIGDHQPRIPVSESDATFSVPVHVLSRDVSVVAPFAAYGFREGFVPDAQLAAHAGEHRRMDELRRMILDVARGATADAVRAEQ